MSCLIKFLFGTPFSFHRVKDIVFLVFSHLTRMRSRILKTIVFGWRNLLKEKKRELKHIFNFLHFFDHQKSLSFKNILIQTRIYGGIETTVTCFNLRRQGDGYEDELFSGVISTSLYKWKFTYQQITILPLWSIFLGHDSGFL